MLEASPPALYPRRMPPYATLRASDADREAVAERLRRAAVEGRLEPHEHEQRLDAAFRAKTYGELDRLLVDLPSGTVRRRPGGGIASAARTAAAIAIPVVVALLVIAVAIAVLAILAAGWMLWVVLCIAVCAGKQRRRRRAAPMRRVHRTRPAGYL
jgi:Domain of unknown function (DUF1707)